MSRTRSARTESFAIGEPFHELRERFHSYMPSATALRRLIPILIAAFLLLAGLGTSIRLDQGKEAALAFARDRLALMVEQVASRESIWEVIKSKNAFESYARGDYSVVPVVLRVANQVDSRPEDF